MRRKIFFSKRVGALETSIADNIVRFLIKKKGKKKKKLIMKSWQRNRARVIVYQTRTVEERLNNLIGRQKKRPIIDPRRKVA